MSIAMKVWHFVVAVACASAVLDTVLPLEVDEDIDAVEGTSLMQSGRATLAHGPSVLPDDPFDDLEDAFDTPKLVAQETADLAANIDASVDLVYWCKFVLDLGIFAIVASIAHKLYEEYVVSRRSERIVEEQVPRQAASRSPSTSPLELGQLMQAAEKGDEAAWRQILDERVDIASAEDHCGCTALHAAAHCGATALAQELLARGADVNAKEAWEETPLHFAAKVGSVETCKLLVAHKAELNSVDNSQRTPVLAAAHANKEACCDFLLNQGGGCGDIADADLPPLLSALLVRRMIVAPAASN